MNDEPAARAARSPSRARGHQRVATVLDAAAELFRDHGFDAVTMSDIAAHSGTAFGSLYRFFPSKEAVADALLARYADTSLAALAALAARAHGLPPDRLADAFTDMMLALRTERSVVLAVLDQRDRATLKPQDGGNDRTAFRDAYRAAMAEVLAAAWPHMPAARTAVVARALLQVLKGVGLLDDMPEAARPALLEEYRAMARAYLQGAAPKAVETKG